MIQFYKTNCHIVKIIVFWSLRHVLVIIIFKKEKKKKKIKKKEKGKKRKQSGDIVKKQDIEHSKEK